MNSKDGPDPADKVCRVRAEHTRLWVGGEDGASEGEMISDMPCSRPGSQSPRVIPWSLYLSDLNGVRMIGALVRSGGCASWSVALTPRP